MKFRFSFLVTLLILNSTLSAQKPEFFREEISFGIDTVFFSINGDYYFRNISNKPQTFTIFYPVSSIGSSSPFDFIQVFDQDNPSVLLETDIHDTVAGFVLKMPPNSVKTIRVFYRQRHNGHEARYILLTTKWWNKPFEKAKYSLTIEKDILISDFSIKPDKSIVFGDTEVFYWQRENFMPDKDFEIKFEIR